METSATPIEVQLAPAPLPGIYRNVPAAEYHAWPYASNSRLSKLLRSPAHMRYEIENPKEPTPALALGSAIHAAVLEPVLFAMEYAIVPPCDKRTKEGKAIFEAFETANRGKKYLRAEEAVTCNAVSAAARRHGFAGPLLQAAGDVELSIVWDDPETGVRCKARPDKLCLELGSVLDLKTTDNAERKAFERSIFQYGYYRQAAMYLDGLRAVGIDISDFVIAALEKNAPYGVNTFRLQDDAVEAGRVQLRSLLAQYARCEASGEWPCYSGDIEDIGLPSWALSTIYAEETL